MKQDRYGFLLMSMHEKKTHPLPHVEFISAFLIHRSTKEVMFMYVIANFCKIVVRYGKTLCDEAMTYRHGEKQSAEVIQKNGWLRFACHDGLTAPLKNLCRGFYRKVFDLKVTFFNFFIKECSVLIIALFNFLRRKVSSFGGILIFFPILKTSSGWPRAGGGCFIMKRLVNR